jgi:galactose mutarotase-like enzyme
MSVITHNSRVCTKVQPTHGFELYTLSNSKLQIAVVPELGAKIISLKNLQTGREWLWHPRDELTLFRNHPGDDFSQSPLAGIDECLPTIGPCQWQGRALPDHGEVWSTSWTVDSAAWKDGILQTTNRLVLSPFQLKRSVALEDGMVRLNYRLDNVGNSEEAFLWALHPLIRLQPGDRLELPASTRLLLNGEKWLGDLDRDADDGTCSKLFAYPVSEGLAAVQNELTGERLEFHWSPSENNTLGLWHSRGGWHGHHQFAIEPSNGEPDSLALAGPKQRCGILEAGGSAQWQITLKVSR